MIRIGIIGCGRILNAHLDGFHNMRRAGLGDCRITALAARPGKLDDAKQFCRRGWVTPREFHPPRGVRKDDPLLAPYTPVSDFQDDPEARPYEDYRRMLADDICDAVLVTSSLFSHHPVVIDALAAGKHVLVQKPMAITVRAARRMCELAEAKGLVLGLVETARYLETVRAQKWAFDAGILGKPQLAYIGAIGGRWSPDKITADTPWRHDKLLAGGGPSIDLGVHFFHELRYLFGEVKEVTAVTDQVEKTRYRRGPGGAVLEQLEPSVEDTFTAVARFECGLMATLFWSWACHGETSGVAGGPAYYGSAGAIKGGRLTFDDGSSDDLLERFGNEADPGLLERWFPRGVRNCFALNQYDWLRQMTETGHRCEADGRQGLHDLAAAYAILESAMAGRKAALDEVLSGDLDRYQRLIDEHYELL